MEPSTLERKVPRGTLVRSTWSLQPWSSKFHVELWFVAHRTGVSIRCSFHFPLPAARSAPGGGRELLHSSGTATAASLDYFTLLRICSPRLRFTTTSYNLLAFPRVYTPISCFSKLFSWCFRLIFAQRARSFRVPSKGISQYHNKSCLKLIGLSLFDWMS